jgi:hypothetical protein
MLCSRLLRLQSCRRNVLRTSVPSQRALFCSQIGEAGAGANQPHSFEAREEELPEDQEYGQEPEEGTPKKRKGSCGLCLFSPTVNKEKAAEYKKKYAATEAGKVKIAEHSTTYRKKTQSKTLEFLSENATEAKVLLLILRTHIQSKLEGYLNIQQPSDWYDISATQLKSVPTEICPAFHRTPLHESLKVFLPKNFIKS